MNVSEGQGSIIPSNEGSRGLRIAESLCFSLTFKNLLTKNLLGPDTSELRAFFWNAMNYRAESDRLSTSEAEATNGEAGRAVITQRVGLQRSSTGERP